MLHFYGMRVKYCIKIDIQSFRYILLECSTAFNEQNSAITLKFNNAVYAYNAHINTV